ncbi:MAG: hypothetical protein V2I25_00730 [Woeseiaceae bacterium]|jgi:hypothetical protein|nr:hypothetical protein [Woeseiaceae bacterium]
MIRGNNTCNSDEPLPPRALRCLLPGIVLLCALATARAEETETARDASWYLQGGSYIHYSDDEDYEGPPWFVGIERRRPGKPILGFSVFNNSFGQFSQYAYVGKAFHPWKRAPGVHIKLTGGIAHGYKGEHQDTSPLNWGDGWAFAIVPTIGYQKDRLGWDVALLSNSGLLFLVGADF